MKRVVLLAMATVFAASMVFAQAGSIGIFGDNAGTNCNLNDKVPGMTPYYVVHVNSPGATACAFAAPKPSCLLAMYLSDTAVFGVTLGNSQTLVSIGYGLCLQSPIHVLTLNYFTQGMTAPCCRYYVTAGTAVSGKIEMVDCAENLLYPTGGQGIVNGNPSCPCNVPAEDTTWGKVKSLYTE